MSTTDDLPAQPGTHELAFSPEPAPPSPDNLADNLAANGPEPRQPATPDGPGRSGRTRLAGRLGAPRVPRLAAIAACVVLLLAVGSLVGYLWVVADHANGRSAWYQQAFASSTASLSASDASLGQTRTQLADAKAKLDTAQAQVRDLANQKAQADDQIADTKKASGLFTAANEATTKCADKLVQIDNLSSSATRSTFDGLVKELDSACSAANNANNALRTFLNQNTPGG
ncbi:hypothetical protein [Lapillicoccus sp.]|uniref:hypothetical protein n=1 Tax=Lapillicoccus sp. TaxID=1909287 RepID=UPI003263BE64